MELDMMTKIYLTGIVIVLCLMWWTSHTRSGRRWLNGDDDEKK